MYIWGWLTVPLLATLTSLWVEKVRKKHFQYDQNFYPLLLLWNSLFLFTAVLVIRYFTSLSPYCDSIQCVIKLINAQVPDWETGKFLVKAVSQSVACTLTILFPIFNILICCFTKFFDQRGLPLRHPFRTRPPSAELRAERGPAFGSPAGDFYNFITPILLGLTALNFSSFKTQHLGLLISVLVCSILFLFHKKIVEFKPSKIFQLVLNVLTILLICFLVFDPAFSINRPHQNPYLDPVCDMLGGKALLVDINSQYGVWVTYFLKILFEVIPLSYSGLTLINMLAAMAGYSMVYVLLRYVLKSPVFAVISILIIILVNSLATLGGEIVAFPSLGPLRFAPPYFLLLIVAGRFHFSQLSKVFQWLSGLLVALTSIWSFETFVYTFAVYGAVTVYESCWQVKTFSDCLKRIIIGIFGLVPFICAAHVLFGLSVYARSGQLPHWNYYLDYIFLYSVGGWGGMPIGLWSPWILLVIIPLGTWVALMIHLVSKKDEQANPQLTIVAGLTALAIIQYTYFVGRSHVNNLFHVSVPSLCLAAYWLVSLARMETGELKWFAKTAAYGCYCAMIFMVFSLTPKMAEKIKIRLPQYPRTIENFYKSPTTPQVDEALYLVKKYAKDKPRIALFIEPDDTTETLMRSRKVHVYPFNYPIIVSISPVISQRVIDFSSPLRTGDYLFLSKEASEFQQTIVKSIQEKFNFIVRETTPRGVYAIELN